MRRPDPNITYETVSAAIEQGGSIRQASKLLGKSYTAVQWWLARNGYEVKYRAKLVRIKRNDSA